MRARFILRVRILSLFAIMAALLLLVRLYFIQIVHGDEYERQASGQYMASAGNDPPRGNIFFVKRDGERVGVAVMQNGWRVAIDPRNVGDAQTAFEKLAAADPTLDRDRFFASAAKKDDPYEEVAFRLTDDEAAAVRNENIPGVLTVRDEWRAYPAGSLAANTIGFVGYKGETKQGVYGLERYYEDTLRHDDGGLYVNPFAEIFSNVSAMLTSDPTAQQGSIVTTMEPAVQDQLETTLQGIMATYTPRQVGGIVMDPKTGAIVAMASLPTFDPNKYNLVDDARVYTNPLVESRYEMGSIMKPLTMAAGIDSGAVTADTTYNDTGCIIKTGARICNYDGRARGVVPMQQVLSQSLNVGASYIADAIGHAKFADYVAKYGLGEETGIDLPNEINGDISALFTQGAADVDFASASFGQAIAVTPIEMTRALASLANGGLLPEPHIVSAIRYDNGIERPLSQADEVRVLKPESAETVTNMLVTVYDDALLNGKIKMDHYSVAAKTGTAQLADPVTHKYYTDRYLHSFFGYFPAHDARFIVFLYAVEPHGVEYASASLAQPFYDMAKFLINYYELPPDR